jgi:hypothetical protein
MPVLRRLSSGLSLVLLALVSACAEPAADDLIGNWLTAREDLQPASWYQTELSFTPFGVFYSEVRSYELISGQNRDGLSAYSRIEGTYLKEGNRLRFQPRRLVWWDAFYGVGSPEQVEEPYRAPLYDSASYIIQDDRLTLSYLSYPLDAPEPTTREFSRAD